MTACLLSSINQPINYYYEGIVATVTQYTSASITPYKITQSSGSYSKTAVTARYANRGAVVVNTNAVTPTSSTAAVKFQYYNGTYWNEVTSSDARFPKFVALSAGELLGLAGYYTTLGLSVPDICGTYIDTLAVNKAFIDLLFANDISVGSAIQSSNYVATSSSDAGAGFKLSADGTADLNSITINGMKLSHDLKYNLALGQNVLTSSSLSGRANVGIGVNALCDNTTGENNIAIGPYALRHNTTGFSNIGIGNYALTANKEGHYNTGIGTWALSSNTTGEHNVGIGYFALYNNSTSGYNTAIGTQSLRYNTTGSYNTAIGSDSLYTNRTGKNNIAIGNNALYSNIKGNYNTGIGSSVLYNNATGSYNTGIGSSVLSDNTAGSYNTGIGYQALYKITTGDNNTGIGTWALSSNTTGSYNIAIGAKALENNTTGSRSIGIGNDTNVPPGWNNSINLNNTIIHLEFRSTCTHSTCFTAITDFTGNTAYQCFPCMGVVGKPTSGQLRAIACAEFTSNNTLQLKNVNETVYLTINKDSSSTIGQNVVLCFMARRTELVSAVNK